jgi:hypothetical protein
MLPFLQSVQRGECTYVGSCAVLFVSVLKNDPLSTYNCQCHQRPLSPDVAAVLWLVSSAAASLIGQQHVDRLKNTKKCASNMVMLMSSLFVQRCNLVNLMRAAT